MAKRNDNELTAVCKEYKIDCGEINITVRRTRQKDIEVVLRRGLKAMRMDYETWQLVNRKALEVNTAKQLLLGTVGEEYQEWNPNNFDLGAYQH